MRPATRLLATHRFPVPDFVLHHGDKPTFNPTRNHVELTTEQCKQFLYQMLLIRRMETRSAKLYQEKKIRGFCHLYIGQEAVAVGANGSLSNTTDGVITAYRDHGWHVVRGGTVTEVIAEMMGKSIGASKGKGGSMHLYRPEANFYGGNGIVGAQSPVGAGVALKFAYKNRAAPEGVCLTLYGDGAANQGQLFEAMNIAALWKLPVIFACENNHYGMGTSVQRASAISEFHKRVDYVPGIKVDGMNVLASYEATRAAKEWCMAGNGPVCIEYNTYRYYGHSMSDPGKSYRSTDEVNEMKQNRDAIIAFTKTLIGAGAVTEQEAKALEDKVKVEVDTAIAEAEAASPPPLSALATDIYHGEKYSVRAVQFPQELHN